MQKDVDPSDYRYFCVGMKWNGRHIKKEEVVDYDILYACCAVTLRYFLSDGSTVIYNGDDHELIADTQFDGKRVYYKDDYLFLDVIRVELLFTPSTMDSRL